MKFIVERIEDDIASLESLETGKITNYNISEIPFTIYEGDVLIFEKNVWSQDNEQRVLRKEIIRNKMKGLWEEDMT